MSTLIRQMPSIRQLTVAALNTASTSLTKDNRRQRRSARPKTSSDRTPNGAQHRTTRGQSNRRNGQPKIARQAPGGTNKTAPWEIPASKCPEIGFSEIEIAEAFICVRKLTNDFLPAGMAFVNYLANSQPYRSRGKAQDIRSMLLMHRPTRSSLISATRTADGMRGAEKREDFLSARLTLLGQRYMLLLTGERSVRQTPEEIASELMEIAGEFRGLNHPRREAYARIIAADVYKLFLRNFGRAKSEMVRGSALLAVVFEAEKVVDASVLMTKLAISGDKDLTDRTVADAGYQVSHGYSLVGADSTDIIDGPRSGSDLG